MEGAAAKPPNFLRGSSAIVWARHYSAEDEGRCDCDKLRHVLQVWLGVSVLGLQTTGKVMAVQGTNSCL